MSDVDLEIVDRDIRLSRQSFDGSDPLDLPVRVWIDQAESLRNEIVQLRADLKALKKRLPTPECRLDEWFSGGCPCDCHPAAKADAQEPRT